MDLSEDKIQGLEQIICGGAYIVSGEAGTGKTIMGLLAGKKLLDYRKPWQKVLYLTYSKLAKRQIVDSIQKLRKEGLLDENYTKRMEVLNYHSLWWQLICDHYSFLGISKKPILERLKEIDSFGNQALDALVNKTDILPEEYLNRDLSINKIQRKKLIQALQGEASVYVNWGYNNFGQRAEVFVNADTFLNWADSIIQQRNRRGLFYHDETICWAFRLLKQHPNILNLHKILFPVLLIDEFQDTDIAQWEMVKLLAPETIIVMADPKQTIHQWRGADLSRLQQYKSFCQSVGIYSIFREIFLTKIHRREDNLTVPNIQFISLKLNEKKVSDELSIFKNKCLITCKSNIIKMLNKYNSESIAILCLTNDLAHDIEYYLLKLQTFSKGGNLPPLNCTRLGADNSPFENARHIVLELLEIIELEKDKIIILKEFIVNRLIHILLPLADSGINDWTQKCRRKDLKVRGEKADDITSTIIADFGLGLIILVKYLEEQAKTYNCRINNSTLNCIRYIGKSIQKVGNNIWKTLPQEEKRRKIDSTVLRYENAIYAHRSYEQVSIMTVHQCKSREFDTVIIPWFSIKQWNEGNPLWWDTTKPEIVNLFHTARTRAKKRVLVICPEGLEAK